jgi:hypothetical protein
MKVDSEWYELFQGSGSASGNSWIEEVCYLGQEQWMLSLRDDPLWTFDSSAFSAQEPDDHSSSSLVNWVIDMDATDDDVERTRCHALLAIAEAVGAVQCAALLTDYLARRDED